MFTHPEFTITLTNQHTQQLLDEAASSRLARLGRRSRRNRRSADTVIDLRTRTSAPPAAERAHLAA